MFLRKPSYFPLSSVRCKQLEAKKSMLVYAMTSDLPDLPTHLFMFVFSYDDDVWRWHSKIIANF